MILLRFAAVSVLFSTIPSTSEAGPIYQLGHVSDRNGNTGPSFSIGPQNTPIDYNFSSITYFTGARDGEVHANVNPRTIGIDASAFNRDKKWAGDSRSTFFSALVRMTHRRL